MKIVFDKVEEGDRRIIEEVLKEHELIFLDGLITSETGESISDAEILSVFVGSSVPGELIQKMPNLKLIVARSTGYDHIDLATAKEKNITVSNVPTYGSRTVAEFAFALLLALSRHAYRAYDRLREEGDTDVKDFEGFDLAGKTLGIVGAGNIGKNMGRIARGFDMNVCVYDVHKDEAFEKEIGCTYKDLPEVVSEADVVSIHVPYIPATHHLVNRELLSKFKKGSYLINTARGGIVDTKALLEALKDGTLVGAGLDVIEGEKELLDELSLLEGEVNDIEQFRNLIAAHALVDMPNVIVTPHIAFNSREAKREILDTTLDTITSFGRGEVKRAVETP